MSGTKLSASDREPSAAALEQTNTFFQTVIDNMPLMMTVKNAGDLNYVLINPAAEKALFKEAAADMIGKRSYDFFAPEQALVVQARDHEVLNSRKPATYEHVVEDAAGDKRNLIATKVPILGNDGEPRYLITITQDVTDRKRAEAALAHASQQLMEKQYAIDQAVTVTVTDAMGTITHVNENFCCISGYDRDELLGKNHRILKSGYHSEVFFRDMYQTIARGQVWRGEVCNKAKSGALFWVDTTIVPQLAEDGQPVTYTAIRVDVTARKQAEAKISYLATHDALTGLGNRALLNEKLEAALTSSKKDERTFAVLLLDLDGFKHVNDTLGHAAGDELLKGLASRLKSSLPDADVVVRLGGDEFAIIHGHRANQREAAIELAIEVLEIVARPFSIGGHDMTIGTSIGIAIAPEDGATAGELLQKADLALYRVKSEGRNNFSLFDEKLGSDAAARLQLLADLRMALSRNEFELQYQPIFDAKTGRCCGAEALVRWRHPIEGILSPDRFIPFAEEAGLMDPLGGWILENACKDAARWPNDIKVAINLSATQFRTATLFDVILCALVESGLPPDRLELEITESVLMQEGDRNEIILRQLRNIGVAIALDDFGTGYSSLSYLTKYPFDKLKIDKSFTQGLAHNSACAASVAAALTLARALDLTVTAEGVETNDQLELLQAAGVHQVQGYLLGRPLPPADLNFPDDREADPTVAAA